MKKVELLLQTALLTVVARRIFKLHRKMVRKEKINLPILWLFCSVHAVRRVHVLHLLYWGCDKRMVSRGERVLTPFSSRPTEYVVRSLVFLG